MKTTIKKVISIFLFCAVSFCFLCQYSFAEQNFSAETIAEAIKKAVQIAKKGDIIVLAGKGHETYQILKSGTIHLDEREVVAEALKEL